jgi:hypothetical protein
VRGWLRDPAVNLVQRGLVNPARGESGKLDSSETKKCMEAGGRRWAGGRSRELVGSRQNSAPTSSWWSSTSAHYCTCARTPVGQGNGTVQHAGG